MKFPEYLLWCLLALAIASGASGEELKAPVRSWEPSSTAPPGEKRNGDH